MFGRFNREGRERHFGHEGRERHAHDGFGHGWRFGRHGRGGFEPREGRMFEGGDLRLVILAMLAEKPSYGYEIIKGLSERVGGGYSPSPGVVYPTLTLVEEMGYATASQEPGGRKLFTVTAEGEAFLAANKPQVDAIFARARRRRDAAPRRPRPADAGNAKSAHGGHAARAPSRGDAQSDPGDR